MKLEMTIIELGQEFPQCSDPACELDGSVLIAENGKEPRAWCTGHAHCEISCFMVGL